MTVDLKELERMARAATPGPWFQVGQPWNPNADFVCAGSNDPHIGKYVCDTENFDGEVENSIENADYIAYANPAAILSLVAELEQARKDAERYRWLQPALISGGALDDDHTLTKAFQHMTTIPTKEEFNAAIDAAIAKEQKNG